MEIRCDCGTFRAQLQNFPSHTPGRLVCYCDDCQTYAHYLGRANLLNASGGTEVVPIYPTEMEILRGRDVLRGLKLTAEGLPRWYASCCNSPIGNAKDGFPWIGLISRVFTVENSAALSQQLGPVKASIQGRFAQGTPPKGTPQTMNLRALLTTAPFLLRGFLFGKAKTSPFTSTDGSPIGPVDVLPPNVRADLRKRLGFSPP